MSKNWDSKTFMQMKEYIVVSSAKKKSRADVKKDFSKKYNVSSSGTSKIFSILDPSNKFSKFCRGK